MRCNLLTTKNPVALIFAGVVFSSLFGVIFGSLLVYIPMAVFFVLWAVYALLAALVRGIFSLLGGRSAVNR